MEKRVCPTPNDNSGFIKSLISEYSSSFWIVSDAEFIPQYAGDYSGVGSNENVDIVYEFMNDLLLYKRILMRNNELNTLLNKTRAVRMGVFVGLDVETENISNSYLTVDNPKDYKKIYPNAIVEIKILDGELFFINS